ncbi:MAG TPA: peptidylprolyl isomerase [Tenuifilaceae bacterium]|nr:peptidylprolyl isomerase [Tenuifilaceae bacterium]HPE17623.1 peptidylprolyl isomerase [Tenuifilaceae bacterium]HPJ44974.1 peptidylprolyl isomerase [Tenuifilaceae bacterium]HPQ33779.1 peptidylprolyl isomerase [Tenuifilaceae bacterium]HRX67671.1 peptidylprolyl isomerase [Tenuifilaceae bacterium]
MATLEKLRNRAGTLVAVVIGLALLSFILSDFLGSGGSLFNRNQFEIAEISGKSIPYQVYQDRVDYVMELNKALSGQSSIDEQTAERIREEIWKEIVQENVLEKNYEKIGLSITPDELFDMVQGNNLHPIIIQQFGNPQTGEVNREAIINFLKSFENDPSGLRKEFWLYIEKLIKKDRLFTKYSNLIKKGMYITDLQANSIVENRNKKVDFSFIVKRYSSINDSLVQVTESEIKDYYNNNSQEFQQNSLRDVEYVVFPIVPSDDDNKIAEEWIQKIKNEFTNSKEPVQFINLNSDSKFEDKYVKMGQMPDEELNGWADKAGENETFGPYFDGESYKIARIVEVASLPDSVKARHILFGTNGMTPAQKDSVKLKADSLLRVIKNGGSFARVASNYSNDPGTVNKGGDLGWFPEGMMMKPFNDFCFKGKKGDIGMVETSYGYHIIEVLDKGNASRKVKLAILERKVVPSTRTYQAIYSKASEFAGVNNTYEMFNEALQENKLTKRLASNLRENDKRVAGLENPRELVRWAYRSEKFSVSPVFEFGENFVVATLANVKEEGIAPLENVKEDVKAKVIREKKAEMLTAEIKDAMAETSTLQDVGTSLNVPVQNAAGVSFSSYSVSSLGFEPAVIGAATNAQEGKLVGPIAGNSGVILVSVDAINLEEGDMLAEKERLSTTLQNRASREAYEAIKTNANIDDKRSKFF